MKFILSLVVLSILVSCDKASSGQSLNNDEVWLFSSDCKSSDGSWVYRPYYGKKTWGIKGNGQPVSGLMDCPRFKGASGKYQVIVEGVLESDGRGKFSLNIDGIPKLSGRFPYNGAALNCNQKGAPGSFNLGSIELLHQQKIAVWGQSVYECESGNGAYSLWEKIIFKKVKDS